jgi:DNA-binding transcriptional MerR regulator
MAELRISELAARTGFSPPTLRYYERIGVLPAPRRTAGGYRVYEDRAVERLRFVARAKSLGLSLEETRELAELWARDECRPVQARLTELLHAKRDAAHDQISELEAFRAQLTWVADRLGQHVPDGPCDDECGCTSDAADAADPTDATDATDATVMLGRAYRADAPPIVCTLAAADVDARLDAWRALLAHARNVTELGDGVRVQFDETVDAVEVAALARDEHDCCSFMSFGVAVDRDGVALEVRGHADARPVIDALVGLAS